MDFLRLSTALHSYQNTLSEKEQWTFLWRQEVLLSLKDKLSRANYLVIEVQGKAGSWQAWPAHGCLLPDMLVVAAEGLLDVEQENKQLGLLQMGLLACTLEQLRGHQL